MDGGPGEAQFPRWLASGYACRPRCCHLRGHADCNRHAAAPDWRGLVGANRRVADAGEWSRQRRFGVGRDRRRVESLPLLPRPDAHCGCSGHGGVLRLGCRSRRGCGRWQRPPAFVQRRHPGAVITMFLSNDAAAIILTPVVYTMATRLRLRVMPYLFAVSFVANAASMTLPISNPINVLTADHLRAPLGVYESHLLAASLASTAICLGVFMAVFWRATGRRFDFDLRAALTTVAADRGSFRLVVAGLGLLALA